MILKGAQPVHLILETKGFDELADIKTQAAQRWVDAVNAEGGFGTWRYSLVRKPGDVPEAISMAAVASAATDQS